jgi:uncharacterized protein HemX
VVIGGIFVLALGLTGLNHWQQQRWLRLDPDTRVQRVQRLQTALAEALATIEQIQREVEDGAELLRRLESQAAAQGRIVDLQQPEIEGFSGLLRTENKRSYRVAFGIGALFFGLGVGVTLLVHH